MKLLNLLLTAIVLSGCSTIDSNTTANWGFNQNTGMSLEVAKRSTLTPKNPNQRLVRACANVNRFGHEDWKCEEVLVNGYQTSKAIHINSYIKNRVPFETASIKGQSIIQEEFEHGFEVSVTEEEINISLVTLIQIFLNEDGSEKPDLFKCQITLVTSDFEQQQNNCFFESISYSKI